MVRARRCARLPPAACLSPPLLLADACCLKIHFFSVVFGHFLCWRGACIGARVSGCAGERLRGRCPGQRRACAGKAFVRG